MYRQNALNCIPALLAASLSSLILSSYADTDVSVRINGKALFTARANAGGGIDIFPEHKGDGNTGDDGDPGQPGSRARKALSKPGGVPYAKWVISATSQDHVVQVTDTGTNHIVYMSIDQGQSWNLYTTHQHLQNTHTSLYPPLPQQSIFNALTNLNTLDVIDQALSQPMLSSLTLEWLKPVADWLELSVNFPETSMPQFIQPGDSWSTDTATSVSYQIVPTIDDTQTGLAESFDSEIIPVAGSPLVFNQAEPIFPDLIPGKIEYPGIIWHSFSGSPEAEEPAEEAELSSDFVDPAPYLGVTPVATPGHISFAIDTTVQPTVATDQAALQVAVFLASSPLVLTLNLNRQEFSDGNASPHAFPRSGYPFSSGARNKSPGFFRQESCGDSNPAGGKMVGMFIELLIIARTMFSHSS